MKKTLPLQPITTLRGNIATLGEHNDVTQPRPEWVDTSDSKDVAIDVRITEFDSTAPAYLYLIIETAASLTGKWRAITSYTGGLTLPLEQVLPASTGYGPTDQLLRFIRWRIVVADMPVNDTWSICFRVCVTMK